jgi:hypothetical protein
MLMNEYFLLRTSKCGQFPFGKKSYSLGKKILRFVLTRRSRTIDFFILTPNAFINHLNSINEAHSLKQLKFLFYFSMINKSLLPNFLIAL